VDAEQLEMFAAVADLYSRGWGHLTTRQNVQFHFVELRETPEALRLLASVGLTSREACGDTVRNVAGCHLAGACPFEVLDISPWAQAATDLFLRNPIAQRLPRKFKINFSGCATDCGQAMFNDVGVIAISRALPDGTTEPGFRIFLAGGLGANPHPAQALEEFTSREDLLPTIEAVLRTFDHYGNRDNKLRARMKWLVDTMGIEELRERIIKERTFLRASATWPGGIPAIVEERGDAPAGTGTAVAADGGVPVELTGLDDAKRWELANVVRGRANGTVSAYAHAKLGDITSDQFRKLAEIQRELGVEVRVTNRQNFVLRGLTEDQLPVLYERLVDADMHRPGAELARDVVSCPGADTCNLAVTQSRGLAADIDRALEEAGLAEVGGVRVNISGCTNSCGQHHIADIGFVGLERRAHGRSAPGYQMLLGGQDGNMEVTFGEKATKLPAKAASEAVVRVVGKFAGERQAGETFSGWLTRSGGAAAVGTTLKELDEFPTPEDRPDFYIDFDETGPYVAETGESECAT
jgi:sulfite reductase beta subunit-like hemoprotein